MHKPKVIAIFDIGKTHKKLLLFDEKLNVIDQQEEKFQTILDEDGFECDDIWRIEKWILASLSALLTHDNYEIAAVNFCTYGASLVFINSHGQRLAPLYNYLKEVPESIQTNLFNQYGGEAEFCRRTASPALGLLLNSGIQVLWFKQQYPEKFQQVTSILHFPQYLSYLLTGRVVSEPTSIGCHTFLWDFDNDQYHSWLQEKRIDLPQPLPNTYTFKTELNGKQLVTGIGIHDSSASLVPYIRTSKQNFILVSTGTWCINMNPFNHSPLTQEQLRRDCLAYLGVDRKPVKSSRLFMGHIHDVTVKHLCSRYSVTEDHYKEVKSDKDLIRTMLMANESGKIFFREGIPSDYVDKTVDLSQFNDFSEVYHRLVIDLSRLNAESINLIADADDQVRCLYVSGGFARNKIFMYALASLFPDKKVYTAEIDNSSALGAALAMFPAITEEREPAIDLHLQKWEPLI